MWRGGEGGERELRGRTARGGYLAGELSAGVCPGRMQRRHNLIRNFIFENPVP